MISFSVEASPSSEAAPTPWVIPILESVSSQSSSAQIPSLSASPPLLAQGSIVVPAQEQPSARMTSFSVVVSPSSQEVPAICLTPTLASVSSQSSLAQIPSLSASPPLSAQAEVLSSPVLPSPIVSCAPDAIDKELPTDAPTKHGGTLGASVLDA